MQKTKKHQAYNAVTIVSFLLPIVGILLGIIYLTKKEREDVKLGEHAIAISLLAGILYTTIIFFTTAIQMI